MGAKAEQVDNYKSLQSSDRLDEWLNGRKKILTYASPCPRKTRFTYQNTMRIRAETGQGNCIRPVNWGCEMN